MRPNFPIYIPSKGRWESRLTARTLERLGVPYLVVVERQEYESYCSVIDPLKILVLDEKFKDAYDTYDVSDSLAKGSGPARNFIWEHAIASGVRWHWIMDDNIRAFYRLNRNTKTMVADGMVLRCMEDFVLRYENIGMAGPNYHQFNPVRDKRDPFRLNTRIYSCNLIRNDVPFRWRGRFNEDTDLSLRMLKAGWCTVLFNAFLQDKKHTLTMKGGNTDAIYKGGTLPKSQMIVDMHPDVCRLAWRFGRAHHFCDYKSFQHGLIKKAGIDVPAEVDNYGMELVQIKPSPSPSCGDTT